MNRGKAIQDSTWHQTGKIKNFDLALSNIETNAVYTEICCGSLLFDSIERKIFYKMFTFLSLGHWFFQLILTILKVIFCFRRERPNAQWMFSLFSLVGVDEHQILLSDDNRNFSE